MTALSPGLKAALQRRRMLPCQPTAEALCRRRGWGLVLSDGCLVHITREEVARGLSVDKVLIWPDNPNTARELRFLEALSVGAL